jgi:hypothetical protein
LPSSKGELESFNVLVGVHPRELVEGGLAEREDRRVGCCLENAPARCHEALGALGVKSRRDVRVSTRIEGDDEGF